MSDVFLLSVEQMARISPHFPLPHGVPRVDDRKIVSGTSMPLRTSSSGFAARMKLITD